MEQKNALKSVEWSINSSINSIYASVGILGTPVCSTYSHLSPITVYVNILILPVKCGKSIYNFIYDPGGVQLSHTFNGSITAVNFTYKQIIL